MSRSLTTSEATCFAELHSSYKLELENEDSQFALSIYPMSNPVACMPVQATLK